MLRWSNIQQRGPAHSSDPAPAQRASTCRVTNGATDAASDQALVVCREVETSQSTPSAIPAGPATGAIACPCLTPWIDRSANAARHIAVATPTHPRHSQALYSASYAVPSSRPIAIRTGTASSVAMPVRLSALRSPPVAAWRTPHAIARGNAPSACSRSGRHWSPSTVPPPGEYRCRHSHAPTPFPGDLGRVRRCPVVPSYSDWDRDSIALAVGGCWSSAVQVRMGKATAADFRRSDDRTPRVLRRGQIGPCPLTVGTSDFRAEKRPRSVGASEVSRGPCPT